MPKAQRTSIKNISSVGQQLSEEHLRLATGGRGTLVTQDVTYDYVGQTCRMDSDPVTHTAVVKS